MYVLIKVGAAAFAQVSERTLNADPPTTYIVRLRPEPNAADPIKALRRMLQTSRQQFGLQCIGIQQEESESSPAGENPHPAGDRTDLANLLPASSPIGDFCSERGGTDQGLNAQPAPVVAVRRSQCGCQLIVERCPFCNERHVHGDGGNRRRGNHGHRLSHCRRPPTPDAGYLLVEVSEPITWVRKCS
jgi:hypothetical protein